MTKNKENGAAESKNQTRPQMPLFYQNPMPIDSKKHKSLALKKNFGFGFTKTVNAVPVNMIEIGHAFHYYPIAFSPDDNATPVAILGLRDNENLFLDAQNNWIGATYIPAYIRRYPFIFSELPDSDQLTLCIDNAPEVIEEKGDQKLFTEDGKPSELAQNALDFCKKYHAAAMHTLEFSRALSENDLLVERETQIAIAGNKRINFSGFRIIDEKKLSEMSDKTFLEWRKKGWLPFVYAHLYSGAQWQRLSALLNERIEKEAA
ncbi:MAG: sapC family protein [Alphaproteobacteria bacterium]|nr:sapC family protein [Alphaproteobacteria bacterium]